MEPLKSEASIHIPRPLVQTFADNKELTLFAHTHKVKYKLIILLSYNKIFKHEKNCLLNNKHTNGSFGDI